MSWSTAPEPTCAERTQDIIANVIEGKPKDIGAFSVRRVLPSARRRMVGPYIFFDHMGPAEIAPGRGMDVRPHPHVNLATVTYLFEGEIQHRDSLGSDQAIQPGAINWMTAGRGIVHSERTPEHLRGTGSRMHGIQLWVALPTEDEEVAPAFVHCPSDRIPEDTVDGVRVRVLLGRAFGHQSPVETLPVMFYVDAAMPAGTRLTVPTDYSERAAYLVSGSINAGGSAFAGGQMVVFTNGCEPVIEATQDSRLLLLGGEPVGERFIWWNFVSSSKQRLEAAKAEWKQGPGATDNFPLVPGDSDEFIPLPE